MEFSDGGFHLRLRRQRHPRSKNRHHGVRAGDVFRFGTREDQAIVTVLQLRHVDVEHLSNMV